MEVIVRSLHLVHVRLTSFIRVQHHLSHNMRPSDMWAQRRLRSAQSDQCLRCSHERYLQFSTRTKSAFLTIQNMSREDSDDTVLMRRLIWIFAGHKWLKIHVLLHLISFWQLDQLLAELDRHLDELALAFHVQEIEIIAVVSQRLSFEAHQAKTCLGWQRRPRSDCANVVR